MEYWKRETNGNCCHLVVFTIVYQYLPTDNGGSRIDNFTLIAKQTMWKFANVKRTTSSQRLAIMGCSSKLESSFPILRPVARGPDIKKHAQNCFERNDEICDSEIHISSDHRKYFVAGVLPYFANYGLMQS